MQSVLGFSTKPILGQTQKSFVFPKQVSQCKPLKTSTKFGGDIRTRAAVQPNSQTVLSSMDESVEQLAGHGGAVNRVAYQGVPGAYSEGAAKEAFPGCETLPCDQFEAAFQALSQWVAEAAVLPIENSLGGSIHTVYDLLLRYRLHIVGEVLVPINHCLMAQKGTSKGDLKRVMSHPQALAQCDGYLRKLPVVKEAVDDTAGAAKMIVEQNLQNVAAIASRRASELYDLEVLDEGIQDMQDNVTRFIVLSRDPMIISPNVNQNQYKTSIVFSLKEGPGQLFKALSVFALRDIDMTKMESRPLRTDPMLNVKGGIKENGRKGMNYLFYVDFIGTMGDITCQNALRHLQEIAPFLRVLGSYPMDTHL